MVLEAVLWIGASYLIGSIPFGLLVSRYIFGEDLRKLGSGNIGATNVLRNFGVKPFLAVMLLDMGKGVAAVAVGRALGLGLNLSLAAGMVSIVGHNWSIFLKFEGGKGIATSGGVIIAAYPWQVTVAVLGVFVIVLAATRIMSVASLSGALAFPVTTALALRGEISRYWPFVGVAAIAFVFALFKHRDNIRRLAAGEEPRLKLTRGRSGEGEA